MSELGINSYWFDFCGLLARWLSLQVSALCQIVRMETVKEKENETDLKNFKLQGNFNHNLKNCENMWCLQR